MGEPGPCARRELLLVTVFLVVNSGILLQPCAPQTPAFYFLEGEFVQLVDYSYAINATVRGDGTLEINMPLLQSFSELDYRQEVRSQEVAEAPDATHRAQLETYEGFDYPYVELGWVNAPERVIVTRTASLKQTVEYRPFITNSPFPVDVRLFDQDISQYLRWEQNIQVNDTDILELAEGLTEGALCQMDAVVRVLNWVGSNINYACPGGGQVFSDASSTLRQRAGNCVNFANLAVALLRAAGIPSMPCNGFVADRPRSSSAHAWISVLYPDVGWVEYESSYWMPTGNLVPTTFLMPQHITTLRPPVPFFGTTDSPSFEETHEASWTILSVPSKSQAVRFEALNGETICFPLVAESQGFGTLTLSWSEPPAGWEVASSLQTLNFSNSLTLTFLLTVVTPETGELDDTLTLTVSSPGGASVGNVVVEIVSPPAVTSIAPSPGSIVNARPRVQVNYTSQRTSIDLGRVKIELDGSDVTAVSSLTGTSLTYAPTHDLPEGTHTVRAEVWGDGGHVKFKEWSFVVDSSPPVITVVSPTAGSTSRDKKVNIEVTIHDSPSGVNSTSAILLLDGVIVPASVVSDRVTYSTPDLTDGPHRAKLEVRDKVGNLGSSEWTFEVSTGPDLMIVIVIGGIALVTVAGAAIMMVRRGPPSPPLPEPPPPPQTEHLTS